ncbi:hypothetical protein Dsin_024065 [Dipteronia sinensis]|uniref:Protein kinase domain-containing protein n=1 Tax=Dipteronia sinensis TaxID=43782 RepID=A0AAE0E185_9ROSI|nr:hypothetical protein Dsin_024065 [Dipteronia sinensis]
MSIKYCDHLSTIGYKRNDSLELKSRSFTYSEILRITDNFKRVLGKGGFGTVYHGYLGDTQVAVKILSSSSTQWCKEFQVEITLLQRVHHRNLTKFAGYCNEGAKKGLIYEYMANGNLQQNLLDRNASNLRATDISPIALLSNNVVRAMQRDDSGTVAVEVLQELFTGDGQRRRVEED